MRPIDLKISAFGPYAQETDIPMSKLGSRGLYLITGDTGAGKTTIFDAISFALFGAASGDNRDAGMFRSKYAADDTPTYVELTFEHAGEKYFIRRSPEYMRPAKRGEGLTRQLAEAQINFPDGRVITKIKDVTVAVEELLGINKQQFSQIAMLAQGDFLKMLYADTKGRMEIFRKLFRTEPYRNLQYALEDKRKAVEGEAKDARKSIDQYISGIQAAPDDELSTNADKAKAGELTTAEVIELLDVLTDTDQARKDKTASELEGILKEMALVNERIGKALTVQKAKETLSAARDRLEPETEKLNELKAVFEKAKKALEEKEGLDKEKALIEAKIPDYDRLDELTVQINKLMQDKADHEKKLNDNSLAKETKSKEIEEYKKELASLSDSPAESERIKAAISENLAQKESLDELSKSLTAYEAKSKELETLQNDYAKKSNDFADKNSLYESKEQLFRDGQAGILASTLKEGEKCPVCGSTSHPSPAHMPPEVPTEAELEALKKDADKARKLRDEAAVNIEGVRSYISALTEEITKKSSKLTGTDDIDKITESLGSHIKANEEENLRLSENYKKCEASIQRKNKLDEMIPKTEADIRAIDQKTETLKSDLSAFETGIKEKGEQAAELKKSLIFENKPAALNKINELREKSDALKKAYEEAEAARNKQQELITDLNAQISSNEEIIKTADACDMAAENDKLSALTSKRNELMEKDKVIAARLSANENTRTSIIAKSGDLTQLEEKLAWIGALAATANGRITGKEKIMLETYVQMTYFDRIIERANVRFLQMSSGQYELVRLKEAQNAQSQSGLELGVTDHYNGSERAVKSLSGGESFMASLSLALGLSDEIQSNAGGIRIDTIFVDEGFGSLDPKSLEQAYRALAGLTEGNKLVGIISHVADLKDRIDKQIVVTKTGGVSTVRIEA